MNLQPGSCLEERSEETSGCERDDTHVAAYADFTQLRPLLHEYQFDILPTAFYYSIENMLLPL